MKPFPYQLEGATWLAGKDYALLTDEPGLGKSMQAVLATDAIGAERVVVMCPAIVRAVWAKEFKEWSGRLPITTVTTRTAAVPSGRGVFILSYDVAEAHRAALTAEPADVMICDECHFLKDRQSAQTIAVLGDMPNGDRGIGGACKRAWFLSGTPVPNHAAELYPILRHCGVYVKGYWDFVKQYCRTVETRYGVRVTATQDVTGVATLLKGFMLRRTKANVAIQLPDILVGDLPIEPCEIDPTCPILPLLKADEPAAAARIAEAMRRGNLEMLASPHIASVRRLIGLAKVFGVYEQLKYEFEVEKVRKIVVFAIHRDVLLYLMRLFPECNPVMLWGGTPEKKRTRAVERFQNNPAVKLAVCQVNAASTGITLTAADRLLIVEPSWSPADNWQAMQRVHRIGQSRTVRVSYCSLVGSIDESVNRVLARKANEINAILS